MGLPVRCIDILEKVINIRVFSLQIYLQKTKIPRAIEIVFGQGREVVLWYLFLRYLVVRNDARSQQKTSQYLSAKSYH